MATLDASESLEMSSAPEPPPEEVETPLAQEEEGLHDEDELVGGFDSGYDTDPVDRFFVISRWQRQLRHLQQRIKPRTHRAQTSDSGGPTDDGGGGASGSDTRAPRTEGKSLGTALQAPLRGIRQRQKQVTAKLVDQRTRVVSTIRQRQQKIQQRAEEQVNELQRRLDKLLSKARYAKVRQLRHMICFCLSMVDLVVVSFWLGASPETIYRYYTIKMVLLIGTRAIWYRWHGWHYFLFDLCYFSNGVLMAYMWLLPSSEDLFMAVYGFSGVLLISVPVFRNSFVPHSLDRVTSVQVHLSPALQMWVLRWCQKERDPTSSFAIPTSISVVPSICFYLMWACTYALHQFVFERRRIELKGYATLYHHMAIDMGILNRLPKRLQGPWTSRITFMVGHFTFFSAGLPLIHFPYWLHTACLIAATIWCFKNGAQFYITYFWKVYDTQIHAFEQQVAAAQATADSFGKSNIGTNAHVSGDGSPMHLTNAGASKNGLTRQESMDSVEAGDESATPRTKLLPEPPSQESLLSEDSKDAITLDPNELGKDAYAADRKDS